MNDQPSPRPRPKRWKWILGIAAILFLSTIIAALAILSSFDFNALKPLLTQVVKQETGRDLEIRGAIDFHLGLRPSLVMEDLVFQNAPWASSPEMVKIKRLEAKVKVLPLLNGDISISRLVMLEPEVFLETDKAGKGNFEFEKPRAPSQKNTASPDFALPRMAFHEVQIEKGKISYRDGGKGTLYSIAIDRFTAHSEGLESPMVLAFNGSYKDNHFELNGTVGSLLHLKGSGKGYPLDLILKTSSAQLKVEGTIQDALHLKGLSLKASAEIQSTSQMTAFLGGEILPVELGPLQMTAAIFDGEDKTYKLTDFRISSKVGDAGGSLTLALGGERLKLHGTVASQKLDLNPFLNGEKTKQRKTEIPSRKDRIFPNDSLPLHLLKGVDFELKIDAGQVQAATLALKNLSMEATLEDGRLMLKTIKVTVAGGDAEGRVEVRPQGGVATAKAVFKANQMDLRMLSSDRKVKGKVDVDLDLVSRGSTIAGLMAALNGRTVVVLGQGRVDNKTLQILGGDLASGAFQLLNPSINDANHMDINCAVSGFDIKDGTAKVTALVVDTPDMTVIGEGVVNLRDETLNLALKPFPKGGAAGFNFGLAQLAKSFKLGGTLATPSLELDAEQTMFAALKAAGGVLLFGPAGIVAALAGQSTDGGNPCLAAIESAKKGAEGSGSDRGEAQNGTESKGIAGTLKGVGESVKKLFSGQGPEPRSDSRSDVYKGGGP
jgi:AsmA family protein